MNIVIKRKISYKLFDFINKEVKIYILLPEMFMKNI